MKYDLDSVLLISISGFPTICGLQYSCIPGRTQQAWGYMGPASLLMLLIVLWTGSIHTSHQLAKGARAHTHLHTGMQERVCSVSLASLHYGSLDWVTGLKYHYVNNNSECLFHTYYVLLYYVLHFYYLT